MSTQLAIKKVAEKSNRTQDCVEGPLVSETFVSGIRVFMCPSENLYTCKSLLNITLNFFFRLNWQKEWVTNLVK